MDVCPMDICPMEGCNEGSAGKAAVLTVPNSDIIYVWFCLIEKEMLCGVFIDSICHYSVNDKLLNLKIVGLEFVELLNLYVWDCLKLRACV